MTQAVYLVPDMCIQYAIQGVYVGDVYVVVHWDVFHQIMEHDGMAEQCETCAIMYAKQFTGGQDGEKF